MDPVIFGDFVFKVLKKLGATVKKVLRVCWYFWKLPENIISIGLFGLTFECTVMLFKHANLFACGFKSALPM